MPLQIVESRRLYRQIADQLRALIVGGEFAAGARLPAERDLSRQLGVSRPSVREALIALEVEGWVEVRTGSGVYVLDRARRTPESAPEFAAEPAGASAAAGEWGPLELIRARRVIEGETAALAATSGRRRDIEAMTRAIAAMREATGRNALPLDGDRAFHLAVVEACGNAVLADTVQTFWHSRQQPIYMRLGGHFENANAWRKAIAEHEAVRDAVAARDAQGARAAMHAHLDKSHRRFSASWRRAQTS
jgi:DNA-binding FadR family transcriptional regulator